MTQLAGESAATLGLPSEWYLLCLLAQLLPAVMFMLMGRRVSMASGLCRSACAMAHRLSFKVFGLLLFTFVSASQPFFKSEFATFYLPNECLLLLWQSYFLQLPWRLQLVVSCLDTVANIVMCLLMQHMWPSDMVTFGHQLTNSAVCGAASVVLSQWLEQQMKRSIPQGWPGADADPAARFVGAATTPVHSDTGGLRPIDSARSNELLRMADADSKPSASHKQQQGACTAEQYSYDRIANLIAHGGRHSLYAPAVTRQRVYIKTAEGLEPGDIPPGVISRMTSQVARDGYIVVGAVVRPGCVEVVLELLGGNHPNIVHQHVQHTDVVLTREQLQHQAMWPAHQQQQGGFTLPRGNRSVLLHDSASSLLDCVQGSGPRLSLDVHGPSQPRHGPLVPTLLNALGLDWARATGDVRVAVGSQLSWFRYDSATSSWQVSTPGSAETTTTPQPPTSRPDLRRVSPLCTLLTAGPLALLAQGCGLGGDTRVEYIARHRGRFLDVQYGGTVPFADGTSGNASVMLQVFGCGRRRGLITIEVLGADGSPSCSRRVLVVANEAVVAEVSELDEEVQQALANRNDDALLAVDAILADLGTWFEFVDAAAPSPPPPRTASPHNSSSALRTSSLSRAGSCSAPVLPHWQDLTAEIRNQCALPLYRARMQGMAMHLLAYAVERGWPATACALVKGLVTVEAPLAQCAVALAAGSDGLTLLHRAVLGRSERMVGCVLAWAAEHGTVFAGNWDVQDRHGVTPLHLCASLMDSGEFAHHVLTTHPGVCSQWWVASPNGSPSSAAIADVRGLRHLNATARRTALTQSVSPLLRWLRSRLVGGGAAAHAATTAVSAHNATVHNSGTLGSSIGWRAWSGIGSSIGSTSTIFTSGAFSLTGSSCGTSLTNCSQGSHISLASRRGAAWVQHGAWAKRGRQPLLLHSLLFGFADAGQERRYQQYTGCANAAPLSTKLLLLFMHACAVHVMIRMMVTGHWEEATSIALCLSGYMAISLALWMAPLGALDGRLKVLWLLCPAGRAGAKAWVAEYLRLRPGSFMLVGELCLGYRDVLMEGVIAGAIEQPTKLSLAFQALDVMFTTIMYMRLGTAASMPAALLRVLLRNAVWLLVRGAVLYNRRATFLRIPDKAC